MGTNMVRRLMRAGHRCVVYDDPSSGSGATGISKSELKNQELVVGAWRFELQTSCAQGSCKKSILLVRLALFCVMVHGFGPNLSA
ncbi:MAG: hypothetical protein WAN33_12630, partial [Candidatus Acidiferrales bacterium]